MKDWSLANKLLAVVLALTLTMTVICGAAGFFIVKGEFLRRQSAQMAAIVAQRARTQDFSFTSLALRHNRATAVLNDRLHLLHGRDVDAAFDHYFPRQPGGGRHTPEDLFWGRVLPDGDAVSGVIGAVPAGDELGADERRLLLAAYQIARQVGPAQTQNNIDFSTLSGAMVIFNPQDAGLLHVTFRNNRTMHDFDAIGPAANPGRQTVCEPLALIGVGAPVAAPQLLRRCSTPVYVDGRLVGAWATMLGMDSGAARRRPGAFDLVIDAKGQPVAYLDGDRSTALTPAMATTSAHDLGLSRLIGSIDAMHSANGALDSPDHRNLVAFAPLQGTSWRLITAEPKAPMEARAAWAALLIVGSGMATLVSASLLIFLYARNQIVSPLQRLASHSERSRVAGAGSDAAVDDLLARKDEIGHLANQLAAERARADESLQQLEERVARRTAELERANRAKSSFVANMSHELRTPLNGIVALSDILAKQQADPQNRATAELVVSSARLLEQVLTDVLDISKIEAGQMSLCFEYFDLEQLIERIAGLHAAAAGAKEKPVTLSWSVAPEAAGRYLGDEVRITQILSNLLSNAVKFTAQGEVTLAVEPADQGLRLMVRDTGVGFPQAMAARLFRRFEQADASTTRQYGGTGLGLSICASLSELMGGSISAMSAPGKGATFTVLLPIRRVQEAAEPAAIAPEEAVNLQGVRILQAEDHPTNQTVTQLSLEPFGVELTTVGNGALAVEAAAAKRFDVILMDLHMPVMDGLTAIGLIRAQEAATGVRRAPIVALTADVHDEQVRATREAGADIHLAKPFRPHDLVAAIVHCLALRGQDDADVARSA